VRTIARLQEAGVRTVFLDLQKFGRANVTPKQWYPGLISETGSALGLRRELLAYAKENSEYSPVQRFMGALGEVALTHIPDPLVQN